MAFRFPYKPYLYSSQQDKLRVDSDNDDGSDYESDGGDDEGSDDEAMRQVTSSVRLSSFATRTNTSTPRDSTYVAL